MNIEIQKNEATGDVTLVAKIPRDYVASDCEAYGPIELCDLITPEQGFGIIEDAILMAMHMKRRNADKFNQPKE